MIISMAGKVCFVSVDVEDGIENLGEILSIFKKYDIPATLFVTGEVLQKYPEKFRELAAFYEIACHSFTHRFWNTLNKVEKQKELTDFINLYQRIFQKKPLGFRAPSHIIDEEGLKILEEKGFFYDSSIVPRYPLFKKYRGYKGRKPLSYYYPVGGKMLEIPVRGQLFGIPLAGTWISKLPFWFYKVLFFIHCPEFLNLSIHSWNELRNFEKIIKLLKSKNYQFLNGEQIYKNYR